MHASFSTRPSMPLFPGSIWRGSQRSGSHEYDVEIRICNVDELGDVSGRYLKGRLGRLSPDS